MNSRAALAFVRRHGIVLESARGPVPSLAQAVAGTPIRGSWWSHPRGHEIFWLTRAVRRSPSVLVCRLLGGKITYVHRRLWPAIVRLAQSFGPAALAAVHEEHTPRGRHQVRLIAFPRWVPAPVKRRARQLRETQAKAMIERVFRSTDSPWRKFMRIRALLLAACVAIPAFPAPAPSQGASAARDPINIPFERYTLPNGLNVILSVDRTIPQAAVDVWYHVGSKNEVPGRTGFAHMFEHVMFTGSGHVPYGMHDRLTEGVGGNNNGSTSNDRTNYFENVPSNYVESSLWLESDRMGFLLDKLDEAKFVAQRDIVQNERRQGIDNQPYGRAFEILTAATLPDANPYSWPVVGYMADLQKATAEDVKQFFRLYYAPSNATLAMVGDIDPAKAKTWVTKYFGDLPRGAPLTRPTVPAVAMSAEQRLVFEDRVQVPRIYLAWPAPGEDNDDTYALDFLAEILSGPRTARITKALVYDQQSAAAVSAFNDTNEQLGAFVIIITPRPGHTLTELEAATDSIIARLKRDGPTADEMQRTAAGLEFDFVSALESNLGKAEILTSGLVFHGDAAYYRTQYAKLKAVTAADVQRVANRYLSAGRAVLSIVPEGKPDQASKLESSRKVTVSPDGGHYIMEAK